MHTLAHTSCLVRLDLCTSGHCWDCAKWRWPAYVGGVLDLFTGNQVAEFLWPLYRVARACSHVCMHYN